MILTQQDVLLIKQTFDNVGYTGYADRFGAFLVDNQDEEEFVLLGKKQQGQLAFTGFVASGMLELEQRIEALEEQNKRNAAHIARLALLIDMLRSAQKKKEQEAN